MSSGKRAPARSRRKSSRQPGKVALAALVAAGKVALVVFVLAGVAGGAYLWGKSEAPARKAVARKKNAPPPKSADAIAPKFYRILLNEERPDSPGMTRGRKKARSEPPARKPSRNERVAKARAAAPREEMDGRPPDPPVQRGRFTIQVVSVQKFAHALKAFEALRKKGFRPFIEFADLGSGGTWYRVRVGRYPDKREAEKALSAVRAKTSLPAARITAM